MFQALQQTVVDGAAGLLVVAGVAKLRSPTLARTTLLVLGLPSAWVVVVLLALCEIAVGAACLVLGSAIMVGLLSAMYLAFAGVVLKLGHSVGGIVSCGCFGHRDAAVRPWHAGLNALCAAVAASSLPHGAQPIYRLVSNHPLEGILYIIGVLVLVRLSLAGFVDLPRIIRARSGAAGERLTQGAAT